MTKIKARISKDSIKKIDRKMIEGSNRTSIIAGELRDAGFDSDKITETSPNNHTVLNLRKNIRR